MSNESKRNDAGLKGALVGVAVLLGVALLSGVASLVIDINERRDQLQVLLEADCEDQESCDPDSALSGFRSAVAAEDIVDLAVWQLVLSALGILFVALTLRATLEAVRDTKEAVQLARRDYVATHRPRIRVRHLRDEGSGADQRRIAHITVANIGAGVAIIESVGGCLAVRDQRTKSWHAPGLQASADGHGPPPHNRLESGEQRTWLIPSVGPITAGQIASISNGSADMFAVGEVRYRDENGILRHTAFMWRWEIAEHEYYPVENPQWSYED